MKIEDERCADKIPFGKIENGDVFYCRDSFFMKIPYCIQPKPTTASPSNPYFKEKECNAAGLNKGLFGCLVFFNDDDMVTPVSVKLLVANPGCTSK